LPCPRRARRDVTERDHPMSIKYDPWAKSDQPDPQQYVPPPWDDDEGPYDDEADNRLPPLRFVTFAAFAAVDEPGAEALLGTDDQALIAADSDAMMYGDGGAGKT